MVISKVDCPRITNRATRVARTFTTGTLRLPMVLFLIFVWRSGKRNRTIISFAASHSYQRPMTRILFSSCWSEGTIVSNEGSWTGRMAIEQWSCCDDITRMCTPSIHIICVIPPTFKNMYAKSLSAFFLFVIRHVVNLAENKSLSFGLNIFWGLPFHRSKLVHYWHHYLRQFWSFQ